MVDNKTPEPIKAETTGKAVVVDKHKEQVAPFVQMDKWDEDAIVASLSGTQIETMLYLYPVKSKRGKKDCKIDTCDYSGKVPHQHVTGISVNGVNEIARMMGGIQAEIKDLRIVNINGVKHWRAVAVAKDHFSLNWREAEATAPCGSMRRGGDDDIRGDYSRIIAKNKAERNAIKKILPQHLLKDIADLALDNQKKFGESDIRRLYGPLWAERTRLKDEYFKRMIDGSMGSGGIPTAMPDSAPGGVLPDTATGADTTEAGNEEEAVENSGTSDANSQGTVRKMSQKQYGMLRGKIGASGLELTDDEARAFIQAQADEKDDQGGMFLSVKAASRLIEKFIAGDITTLQEWVDAQKG